jgi:hypothetical protein
MATTHRLSTGLVALTMALALSACSGPDREASANDAVSADVGADAAPVGPDAAAPDSAPNAPDGGDAGSPDADSVPATNAEHERMLGTLHFDTDLGPRTGPDAEPLPQGWHPLRTKYAAFNPKMEICLGGITVNGKSEMILDDAAAKYAAIAFQPYASSTWTGLQYKNGIAVDADGDGLDEFLAVYFVPGTTSDAGDLEYILVDPNSDIPAVHGSIDRAASAKDLDRWAQPSLAVGDIDGDGRAEVAIGFGKLYVVTDLPSGAPAVRSKAYKDQNEVNVAIGNIDRDPIDELVVTHTETTEGHVKGFYEIVERGTIDVPEETGRLFMTDASGNDHVFAEAKVAIGEVDRDGVGEIVLHAHTVEPKVAPMLGIDFVTNEDRWYLLLMKNNRPEPGARLPRFGFTSFCHNTAAGIGATPYTLALLDIEDDGIDEIYGWGQIIAVENGEPKVAQGGVPGWPRAVGANVDALPGDELLIAKDGLLQIWGRDTGTWKMKNQVQGTGNDTPVVAPANVDRDSAVVRYDGQNELRFTDARIISVVSSPPYQDGIGQNVDATSATFGKVDSASTENGKTWGVSAGFSVGYEYESDLFQCGFSMKATFEASFDWYAKNSQTVETYSSYTTDPGQDMVIYSAIPFDVYHYTIVSSPDAQEVDRDVTINIPRAPQVRAASIDYYNANNGGALDVDQRILRHTLGSVWSYPTADDKERILNDAVAANKATYTRLAAGPLQVPQTGTSMVGVARTNASTTGKDVGLSVSVEFEGKAGGVTAGTSVGFEHSYSYEVTTEKGSFFEGTVGKIPSETYEANAYCYGLFVYPQALDGQSFLVMNWWTQRQCSW